MALRVLRFGIVFAIGFLLGPAYTFAEISDAPEVPLSLHLKDPQDVTVSRGQSATLPCNFSPASDVEVTWLHNDQPIKSNTSKRYVLNDGSLHFSKVTGGKKNKGLVGEYRCRVSRRNVSLLSSPAKLNIASFGDFEEQPSTQSVPESQPAVLFCNINSVPAAEIRWEQNTKPLPHNKRYVPLPTGALLITETQTSDAGSYRCIATNTLLKKTKYSKIVELRVSTFPGRSEPPTFLPLGVSPNATVLIGENVNLYCAVNGWPTPTVQWLNNDGIVISNSSLLSFRNVSFEQTGNYTCVAYNSGGRIAQRYILAVHQRPYFNMTPVSKKYPPAKTARLDCQALGVPKPQVYWLKDGELIPNAARIKMHPTGLVISHTFTSDAGIYQCVAVNSVGSAWVAAQLVPTLLDTPSPPENVQCRPFDDTSICLTWQAPRNTNVAAYSIYCYYTVMGREIPGAEFVTNQTKMLATGLNGSTTYTCYIRLYSKIASDRSQKVSCKTGVRGRRNLQVIPMNETSVELSWSQMSNDTPCDNTRQVYRVQWRRKSRTSPASALTRKFSHVIDGLVPSVEYEFRVILNSSKFDNSPWVSFTPKGDSSRKINPNVSELVPIAPEHVEAAVVSPTTINLTWLDSNENSRFFSVCMVESDKRRDCEEGDLLRSVSTSLLITNLQHNSSYDFKVRAHSLDGVVGPFSQFVTIRTPLDVPSKVLNLNYEIINETTACVFWQAPLHKNGKLTSFLVSYTPNANWPLDDWFNKSVPTTHYQSCQSGDDQIFSTLLVGLEPGINYSAYVRAASEVGLGSPIYPIKFNTRDTKPLEQQPNEIEEPLEDNQNLGIIIGVTISLILLMVCVACTVLMRKRCLKSRAFSRARMAASNNYYPAVAQYASEGSSVQVRLENPCSVTALHEIEHLVGDDPTSAHVSPDTLAHLDTKGSDGFPNGHINGSAKPFINGHVPNGTVHITENPRYFALECNGHSLHRPIHEPYEEDSNSNVKSSKFHDLQHLSTESKSPEKMRINHCNTRTSKHGFKEIRPNG